jgi:ribonuclease P protein component
MPDKAQKRLTMTRAMRLRRQSDFGRLRTDGQRLSHGSLVANWQVLPKATTSRLGIITTRKLGNSVVRSRARRLLREAFRLHQQDLGCSVDMVLVARASIAGKKFADVERDFLAAMRRGNLLERK